MYTASTLDDLRAALVERAFCYDDPDAYRAGVEAALAAITDRVSVEAPAADGTPVRIMVAPR